MKMPPFIDVVYFYSGVTFFRYSYLRCCFYLLGASVVVWGSDTTLQFEDIELEERTANITAVHLCYKTKRITRADF